MKSQDSTVENIPAKQEDLRLFLDVLDNGLGATCLPRDVKRRFKTLLEEKREFLDILELSE